MSEAAPAARDLSRGNPVEHGEQQKQFVGALVTIPLATFQSVNLQPLELLHEGDEFTNIEVVCIQAMPRPKCTDPGLGLIRLAAVIA